MRYKENKSLTWGERLARLRTQTLVHGEPMLQEEAARRAGTARETWVRWEARTTPLPDKTLPTIAHALGLTPAQLHEGLGGAVDPPVDQLAMRTLRLLLSLDSRTALSVADRDRLRAAFASYVSILEQFVAGTADVPVTGAEVPELKEKIASLLKELDDLEGPKI